MTDFNIIIPARLGSSRLFEKLLKKIGNKTIIEHSFIAAKKSKAKRVIIAADDEKIFNVAKGFGAEVMLTSKNHKSGTDRLTECVVKLGLPDKDIVVNLQGDEPFIPFELINLCAESLVYNLLSPVATIATRITNIKDIENPNIVKVVINKNSYAMYFSRAGIPFNRDNVGLSINKSYFHHLGIYAYRVELLKRYKNFAKSDLEEIEKLEQLRILDNGENIIVSVVDEKPPKGIDTINDLKDAIDYHKGL